jgi:chromate transporter
VLTLPVPETVRWVPLALAVVAAVLLFVARRPLLQVLALTAVLGLVAGLAGLPVT